MKKLISIALCLCLLLCSLCVAGTSAAAAGNVVVKDYVQKNVRSFADFVKSHGTYRSYLGSYVYFEDSYYDSAEDIEVSNIYLYAYQEEVVLSCIVDSDDPQIETTMMLSIPYTYNSKATVYLCFEGAVEMEATASINLPNYDGTNAKFSFDGDFDSADYASLNENCNYLLENMLEYLNETIYDNDLSPVGLTSFGFCMFCHHSMGSYKDPATLAANGFTNSRICRYCGLYKQGTKAIAKIGSIQLSQTAFYYNGKVQTPKVTVKDSNGKVLKYKIDYTLALSKGRKNVGKYAVVVTFKGNYSGKKVLYYTINPGKTAIIQLSAAKKALGLRWKKVGGVSGYQIQYAANASMRGAKTMNVKGATTLSKTLKNLNSAKTYYVRMRSYKATSFCGKTVYVFSGWSALKAAKVK
ncbi:MAG: fibronectin type III domain-containing protein [Clostridia bacterium]|nr:fibronectin type III domain-containing protein [Clostridia bacterium]